MGKISRKLILQVGFAAVWLTLAPVFFYHINNKENYIVLLPVTVFNSMSWFAGYYFLVILFGAFFLNRILDLLDYKSYTGFLLTFFALVSLSFSGSLLDNLASGLRTLACGLFLYALGGYIRKYDSFKKVRTWTLFIVVLAIYALICISFYNSTETNIEKYMRAGSTDVFYQSMPGQSNFSFIPIIIGVIMFELFRRMRIRKSRIINFVGASTFMVYLIHDNDTFYSIWDWRDWVTTLYHKPLIFMLKLLKWSAATFCVGIMAYVMYVFVSFLMKKFRNIFCLYG